MLAAMKLALHWQVAIALALAVVAGLLTAEGSAAHEVAYPVYDFIGRIFINALKMLIVPLVFSSVVVGIAATGGGRDFSRLGLKTVAYYLVTTAIACLLGLLLVNAIQPGIIDGAPARDRLALDAETAEVAANFTDKGAKDIVDVFVRMVPPNIVEAAANGDMLGLIFFALLFGYFILRVPSPSRETLLDSTTAFFRVMLLITEWVMRFSPIGVFALVARVISTTGFEAFEPLAKFLLAVFLGLGIHFFLVLPLILLLVARVNPLKHYVAMLPAILTAFSTSSSAATIPVTMDSVETRAGVSNRVSSFVIPLGATVNMDGTALFEVVAALFIAQAYGLELTLGTQATVALLALVTSIGVAGIPSASMVAIVLILGNLGLPAEGIGLIFAVDRIPDMCRTVVNIFGDSVGAVVVARSEGEDGVLGMPARGSLFQRAA
jgi:proton glutamate symport protein